LAVAVGGLLDRLYSILGQLAKELQRMAIFAESIEQESDIVNLQRKCIFN
jgi:hypothetical protein